MEQQLTRESIVQNKINVFLLAGQSNMAGRGNLSDVPPISDPRILMFRDGRWMVAEEPIHQDKASAGIGLGVSFAASLLQSHPELAPIGLIPAAIGGSPMESWIPGAELFERAVALTRQALEVPSVLKGILWHQGESDAGTEENAMLYPERFKKMAQAFREIFKDDQVPIIIGELGHFLQNYPKCKHYPAVNEQLRKLAETVPNCRFVSSEGLLDIGDSLHFNATSCREFGTRYAAAYSALELGTMNRPFLPQSRSRTWKARWIWPAGVPRDESNVYAYFRKTFTLNRQPRGLKLFVSADSLYKVFINGKQLGNGPPTSAPWYQYYDEYDVDGLLRRGENCIAVLVYHVAAQPHGDADGRGRGGLLLEVTDRQGAIVVQTDDGWRARIADAWEKNTYKYGNAVAPHVECFDARREPEGWRESGFDDGTWLPAYMIEGFTGIPPAAGIWTKLVPRGIPFMKSEIVLPEQVTRTEESVDLRLNEINLALGLSMTGMPLQYTRCERVATLCTSEGSAVFQGSLEHLDLDFGSLYSPAIILDFGQIVTAHLRLTLDGPAGGVIDIGYAERLIDGQFNIAVDGCAIADRYLLKEGSQVFETFTWKAFRFVKLRFRCFVRPVTVKGVEAVISTYPYEESGAFRSDDETLNGVFEICRNTIRLCSNDYLMDTPWREKAQWLGDVSLVTLPAIHACFGDTALPRKFLLQAGQHQYQTGLLANISNFNSTARWSTWINTIPDYSLWWIGALLEQYLYTGDEELLHRLYPQALRILDTHLDYLNESTLIENMPYWVFLDWADVEKDGVCTAYNAIFYRTLECLHRLAQFKGDAYTTGLTRDLRQRMQASFHATLYDESRGCFADANLDGKLSDKISEHGNITPIWAGLCDPALARHLVNTVFENGRERTLTFTEAQPFFMAVILPALARAERMDLALELIRRRWGKRMLERGATSVYETWQENGRWRSNGFIGLLNSQSHAWSACPADFLIRHLLGLEVVEPGCRSIRLNPHKTEFDYRVVFPTPRGNIRAECRAGKISVTVPEDVTVNSP